MRNEPQAAITKKELDKATDPDFISVGLLEAFEKYGIDKITALRNEIYDTDQIPPDNSKSIFIALPTKSMET